MCHSHWQQLFSFVCYFTDVIFFVWRFHYVDFLLPFSSSFSVVCCCCWSISYHFSDEKRNIFHMIFFFFFCCPSFTLNLYSKRKTLIIALGRAFRTNQKLYNKIFYVHENTIEHSPNNKSKKEKKNDAKKY